MLELQNNKHHHADKQEKQEITKHESAVTIEPETIQEIKELILQEIILHSGPLPPADEFARYNEVYPLAAEKLFKLVEDEASFVPAFFYAKLVPQRFHVNIVRVPLNPHHKYLFPIHDNPVLLPGIIFIFTKVEDNIITLIQSNTLQVIM